MLRTKIMTNTKSLISSKKRLITISAILVLVVVVAFGAWWYFLKPTAQSTTARPVNSVDYSGPTQEEQNAGDNQKEENQNREEIDSQPEATTATVIVTDASQYDNTIEVRAYIPNIYSSEGYCTATFTKAGATTVTVNGSPFKDATTTQCGAMDVNRSAFSAAGTWSVVVSYTSSTATGSSEARSVSIK